MTSLCPFSRNTEVDGLFDEKRHLATGNVCRLAKGSRDSDVKEQAYSSERVSRCP